jgi:hypothetical protein
MKKPTKEEWFAAASAQDLWASSLLLGNHIFGEEAVDRCSADKTIFDLLFNESEKAGIKDIWEEAFLAAQIGCEKAGL